MNTEKITLNLTVTEADSLAYVLMSALHETSMLDRERLDATQAANALFEQLGYNHRTSLHGERIENS